MNGFQFFVRRRFQHGVQVLVMHLSVLHSLLLNHRSFVQHPHFLNAGGFTWPARAARIEPSRSGRPPTPPRQSRTAIAAVRARCFSVCRPAPDAPFASLNPARLPRTTPRHPHG